MHRQCGGTWPTEEFKGLSQKAQVEFYRAPNKTRDLKQLYADEIIKKRQELRETHDTGDFYPLTYYANLGLCVEQIKANTKPEDIKFYPQLGECYKVHIHGSSRRISEWEERSQLLQNLSGKKKAKEILKAGASEGKTGSGEDSSSSSSSSSSNGAKKKKKKQAKKDKKEQTKRKKEADLAKAEKLRAADCKRAAQDEIKSEAKRMKDLKKAEADVKKKRDADFAASQAVAFRALQKLQPLVSEMASYIFADPLQLTPVDVSTLPQPAQEMFRSLCEEHNKAKAMLEQASARVFNQTSVILFGITEVTAREKDAKDMLKAIVPFRIFLDRLIQA